MLPSFWALVFAYRGTPPVHMLLIFGLGSFVMRSAGVVINDLADRSLDRHVSRTRERPLASGALHASHAVGLLLMLLILAIVLLSFLNTLTMILAPFALVLATIYPFTKRFFHVPQFVLGVAFGWGAIMAWAASRNDLDLSAWLIFGATVLWALAYDTIYALQDRNDDLRIGIRSSAIFFGSRVWLAVATASLGMLVLLALVGFREGVHPVYYGFLAGVAGFCTQQVMVIRRDISAHEAFSMFRQHVLLGIAILVGIWLGID